MFIKHTSKTEPTVGLAAAFDTKISTPPNFELA